MARRGFGDGVIVVRVREPGTPARKSRETAAQLRAEPVQVIPAELVDRYENDQGGRRQGRRRRDDCVPSSWVRRSGCWSGLAAGVSRETNEQEYNPERMAHTPIIPIQPGAATIAPGRTQ